MIYGSTDAREFPLYSLTEVSEALHLPRTTLYRWLRHNRHEPVIPANGRGKALSFLQLSEAFAIAYLRRRLGIPLTTIRQVSRLLRPHFKTVFPLFHLGNRARSDNYVARAVCLLLNESRFGQKESTGLFDRLLDRFEFDVDGCPDTVYPWIPGTESKFVQINPRVRFGQPTVSGTGIAVTSICERFVAGESAETIATSYGVSHANIKGAIAYAAA